MGRGYAAKVDANQGEIVAALRRAGASVTPTHAAGEGFPDLAGGFRGETFLIEVKDGAKPPSARKLTPDQEKWHATWRGQKAVASTVAEALAVIGIELRGEIS
ncbi:hypothetical protein PXK01_19665 [Phaeobacter sp. PT47_59]|uniref:hypothetical protein n=1 Tax=Phaeobacter sp. PT47_59 TaxID=3029979 RepID=UPI00238031F0|nr:hypothetical protein [Phaeobacter sp. PT47_59]MDE4176380.1 hypothetical protein [Phaeobacter sp. PT47_59]